MISASAMKLWLFRTNGVAGYRDPLGANTVMQSHGSDLPQFNSSYVIWSCAHTAATGA